jgi:hypothetical protein
MRRDHHPLPGLDQVDVLPGIPDDAEGHQQLANKSLTISEHLF